MPTIDKMFAFIAMDDEGEEDVKGDEGLLAFTDPISGMMMPLIGADMDRIDSIRAMAQKVVDRTGKSCTLVVFEGRKDLEKITPSGGS